MKLTLTFVYTGSGLAISFFACPIIPYMFHDQHTSTGLLSWQSRPPAPWRSSRSQGESQRSNHAGPHVGHGLHSPQDKIRAGCIQLVVLSLNPGPQRAGAALGKTLDL